MKKQIKKVLIACEFSGRVREAFRAKGFDAWSCDLLPSIDKSPHHIEGDVCKIINDSWDLMVAHPPCTYLANSGVCHLHKDPKRWINLFEATNFFNELLNAPIKKIAVENPVMHKYAKRLIGGRQQTQTIQPWMFGHKETKATCLWLKNLPPLIATTDLKKQVFSLPTAERQRLHYLPPSPNRWMERSKTFKGIAEAMANQWGMLS